MNTFEAVNRLEEIQEEISDLSDEARGIAEERGLDMLNLDAYVFNHINESLDNGNRYNQSLRTIIEEITNQSDPEEGDYVVDKMDDEVHGEVIDVDEDTVTIILDGEDAIEVELPRGRVIVEEKGPQ